MKQSINTWGLGALLLTISFQPTGNLIVIPPESEDNNTSATANVLEVNGAIAGEINNTTDFYDYFKTTIPFDGKLELTLYPTATFDGYIDLYDWNGSSFIRTSTQTGVGETDHLVQENLKAGTYYIRIAGGGNGSYTLGNIFTPTAIPDGNDPEPDDNSSQAILIPINNTVTGHINFFGNGVYDYYDWYTITLPYDGEISFVLTSENTLDAYIDLYDWNGSSFLHTSSQTGIGINDTLIYYNLKAGSYYVMIAGGGWGSYSLKNVFTPTAIPDGNDPEPNDNNTQALLISTDNIITGHINYFGNGQYDYYDWYTITLPNDGKISFVLIPENTLDASVDLYDWNGSSFLHTSSQTGIGINDTLIYYNLKAGTYYVLVSGGGWGSYSLKNAFTPTAIPDGNDPEPNDFFSQAIPLDTISSVSGHINYFGNGAIDYYDWYSFTLPLKSKVTISALPEQTLDIYFDLYNADNDYLMSSYNQGVGITDSLYIENLDAGIYYISIAGSGYGSYTLNISTKDAVSAEPFEPNQFSIYTDEFGTIRITNFDPSIESTLEIVDLTGKIMLRKVLCQEDNTVSLYGNRGIFIAIAKSGEQTIIKRLFLK